MLVVAGFHRPRRDSIWLWLFLGSALSSSAISTVISPEALPSVNFFTITAVFVVFSSAILATGLERRMIIAVMTALYWCFLLTLLIGVAEIVGNVRLTRYFYPDSSILAIDNRLLVAAYLPNYNDFAVVVAMLALMLLIRILMIRDTNLVQALHIFAYLLATSLTVLQGSRGALIALLVGSVLVVVQSTRLAHPHLISPLSVILGVLGTGLIGALLWLSPFIQDNSTAVRGSILENTLSLTPDTSWPFWFGWGAETRFKQVATEAFPWKLMDPHNVLLEAFTWYGLPTLIALILLWGYVAWRGVWRLEVRTGWAPMAAVVLFSLMPVLGVVSSSSFRYYYIFLLAACSIAALTNSRSRKRRAL